MCTDSVNVKFAAIRQQSEKATHILQPASGQISSANILTFVLSHV